MPIAAQDLEAKLRAAFPRAVICVRDIGADENHYAVDIIDDSFRGQTHIQQQRAVYAALRGVLDGPNAVLHALTLTTKAPLQD